MTPRQLTHLVTNLTVAAAVLIAAYVGNPWAACVLATLFVFVMFPRWRRKIEAMIGKLIELVGKRRRDDSCDPE